MCVCEQAEIACGSLSRMLSGPSALCDDAIERLGATIHVSDGVVRIERSACRVHRLKWPLAVHIIVISICLQDIILSFSDFFYSQK